MAVSSSIRRASWAAACGLLASRSNRSGGRIPPVCLQRHPAVSSSLFSSLAVRQLSAASDALLQVINTEISYAQKDCKNHDWAKELGKGFPFEIQDREGTSRITLRRSHKNEQIEVQAFLPSPANGDVEDGRQADQSEDNKHQNHTDEGVSCQYCIPLTVKVSKGNASCLEFRCSSYPDELIIDSLAFAPDDESDGSTSARPEFSDLPEELQKAFYSYLRRQGISPDVTYFLHAYMINKECHEYLAWLRRLKGLVKS